MGVREYLDAKKARQAAVPSAPSSSPAPAPAKATTAVGRYLEQKRSTPPAPKPQPRAPIAPLNPNVVSFGASNELLGYTPTFDASKVDLRPKTEKAGQTAFEWAWKQPTGLFDKITTKLGETKLFQEGGRILNERDRQIAEGTREAKTSDFLADSLLETVKSMGMAVGSGTGDALNLAGNVINFSTRAIYGEDNAVGNFINGFSKEMSDSLKSDRMRAVQSQEFGKDKLFSADFWLLQGISMLPTTLGFMKLGSGVFKGTNKATSFLGTGKYGTIARQVLATGASATTMRGFESAAEAEDTYNEAISRGKSEQEAMGMATQNFSSNMQLLYLDAGQAALAFSGLSKYMGGKSFATRLMSETGSLLAGGASEGFEELFQYGNSKKALGDEFSYFDPEAIEAGVLGFAMGVTFQGAGRLGQADNEKAKKDYYTELLQNLPAFMQTQLTPEATGSEQEAFIESLSETNPNEVRDALTSMETAHTDRVKATKDVIDMVANVPTAQAVKQKLEAGMTREDIALEMSGTGSSIQEALTIVDGVANGDVTADFNAIDDTLLEKTASQVAKESKTKADTSASEVTQMKKDIAGLQKQILATVEPAIKTQLKEQLTTQKNALQKAQNATDSENVSSSKGLRALVGRELDTMGITENKGKVTEEIITQINSGKGKVALKEIIATVAGQSRAMATTAPAPATPVATPATPATASAPVVKKPVAEVVDTKKTPETKAKKETESKEKIVDTKETPEQDIMEQIPEAVIDEANANWEDNYAEKYGKLQNEASDLTKQLKNAKQGEKPALQAKLDAVNKQMSAIEAEFLAKWQPVGKKAAEEKAKQDIDNLPNDSNNNNNESTNNTGGNNNDGGTPKSVPPSDKKPRGGGKPVAVPIDPNPTAVNADGSGDAGERPSARQGELIIPEVLYHATLAQFEKFDNAKVGENTQWDNAMFGHFFIEDPARATKFAEDTRPQGDVRPASLKKVKINVANTLDLTMSGIFTNEKQAPLLYKIFTGEQIGSGKEALEFFDENIGLGEVADMFDGLYTLANKEIFKNAGYDSIVSDFGKGEDGVQIKEYVVFDAENIEVLGTEAVAVAVPEPVAQKKELTNAEIDVILATVTTISATGEVTLTGKVTEDILEAANAYNPGGKTKSGRGVLDEYYTNSQIVDAIKGLFTFPATGLKVLEPAIGTGNFIYSLPDIGTHDITGFEINPTTARIAKIFHQNAKINVRSFESEFVDDRGNKKDFVKDYDLVIGNPPYGAHRGEYIGLGEEPKLTKFEDYFVKRSMDSVKEGGLVAMVLPSSWLNGKGTMLNTTIESAFRLPTGVFEGTDIGTDIVVLRKTSLVASIPGSEYFKENPRNVLGVINQKLNRFGKMEDVVNGTLDDALTRIDDARQETEAIKILKELDIAITPEAIETVAVSVEEAGTAGAKKLAKTTKVATPVDTKEQTQGKQTIEKKVKKTGSKVDSIVPLTVHFSDIQGAALEMWRKTTPGGYVLNPTETEKKSLNFMGDNYYIDFNYAQGDIYQKLDFLVGDEALGKITEEQADKQRAKLEAVKPRPETVDDMKLTPNLTFVKEFEISDGVKLSSGFLKWIKNLPTTAFAGSNSYEIREYVNNEQVRGSDKDRNELIRVRRKNVADNLFAKYLKDGLDQDQKEDFERAYNSTFNFFHTPDYSKVPMFSEVYENFNGTKFTPNGAQKAGVGRLMNMGVGIIAHEVGFGKTITGVLAAHEAMTRGWAKKPVIIVPNDTILGQWQSTIEQLVPNAKINVLGNLGATFKGDLSSLTIEDGSFSLMTYEGLKRLSFGDDTYNKMTTEFKYISDELDAHRSTRDNEKAKAQAEELKGKGKKGTRADLRFENLGFDHMTFDEVHNANHIVGKVKLPKGTASEFNRFSLRSSDLGIKTWIASQYIQAENDGRNVNLLSATPFTNHPLEYYSILSLVADKALTKMGFRNVNDFFGTFMEAETEHEFKADGTYQKKTDIRSFKNGRQFRTLMKSFIDFQQDIPDIDRPIRLQKTYEIPKTAYVREIEEYAQDIFKEDESESGQGAKVLRAISELRKVSFSPFVSKFGEDMGQGDHKRFVEESPKLDVVMKIVAQNKKDEPSAGQIIYSEIGIESFPLLKDYLVKEVGYAKDEVEIITGGTSKVQRLGIQDRFNAGKVKILLGSAAISEGMNLQFNTTDVHLLSLPWNFMDLRQVIGRAWRQGNAWQNVRINQYFMEDSVDVFLSQKLDNKQQRYENSMKTNANEVDVGDVTFSDLKFNLIKDPTTRAKLEIQVGKEQLNNTISQQKAELAFAVRKLEKVGDYQKEIKMSQDGLERELKKPADQQNDFWVKRYNTDIVRYEKLLTEELAKLGEKGVSVDSLLQTKADEEVKIAALETQLKEIDDTLEARIAEITAVTKPSLDYTKEISDDLVAERARENKTFYVKKGVKKAETITVEKAPKPSPRDPVVATPKKTVVKKKATVTGTKDSRIMNILTNGDLTVAEKVESILDSKQEGKKFKDVGDRVFGSKKENAAVMTILQNGSADVIAELIKTVGAEAIANTLNKQDILENTRTPNIEVDKKNNVPAIIAGWKLRVFNNIAKNPSLSYKRGKYNYTQNVDTREVNQFLTDYPTLLQTFVEELTDITNPEQMQAFAEKYKYKFAKTALNDDNERGYTERGLGVVSIGVLGKTIQKVISETRKITFKVEELTILKEVLATGTKEGIGFGGLGNGYFIGLTTSYYNDFNNFFATKEEAEATLKDEELVKRAQAHIDETFSDYALYAPKKATRKEGIDLTHGNFEVIEKYTRKVPAKRVEAITLTTEMGFKSVQLGNYMDDVSAKDHIEQTIGAIEDMSTTLGVDFPMMFNKLKLSIAFGARGGGSANAHYEPTANIINLTKGRGDGSLFHELVHFMDWKHNTGGHRDKWSSKKDRYQTSRPIERITLRLMHALTGAKALKNKTFKPNPDAYILKRPEATAMLWYKEGKTLEQAIAEVKNNMYSGVSLENVADVWQKEFTEETTVYNEKTDFYLKSKEIGGGSEDSYWVQPHELLARAGQAYMEDKMKEKGMANPYLTRSTVDKKAYPQGDERVRFNKLFDEAFAVLAKEYPVVETFTARFKAKDNSQTVIRSSTTLVWLRDFKLRFGLDFDVKFVDTILAQSADNAKMRKEAEAWGSFMDNTIILSKLITRWTAQHEVGHLVFNNLEKIRIFGEMGITREKLLEAKRTQLRAEGNLKYVVKYLSGKQKVELEEMIMLDFEQYLEKKYQPGAGIMTRFFLALKRLVVNFARAIQLTEGTVTSDFYDMIDEGSQIQEQMIRLETDGVLSAYITMQRNGVLDYEVAEKLVGGARFKIKDEGDKVLQRIKVTYNETETALQKTQEALEQQGQELTDNIERMGRVSELVEQTPNDVKELKNNTTRTDPPTLTATGVANLDKYEFENQAEAEAEIHAYVTNKTELLEVRNSLAKIRREIATLKRDAKVDKVVLKDIERKLKARKVFLEKKDYYVQLGQGQGRKQQMKIIRRRGRALGEVQDLIGLSDAKANNLLKSILGELGKQKIHTLNEKEFDNFIIRFTNEGADIANMLFEQDAVKSLIQDRRFKDDSENNLRKALKLPTITKMSASQAEVYFKALEMYEEGDTFLTQRQLETIHRTNWGNVKTEREMFAKVFADTGISRENLQNVKVDDMQKYKNWLVLSRSNPMFAWLVDSRFKMELETEAALIPFEEEMNAVINKARKSRTRSFTARVRQLIAPMDELVFGYIESENKEQYSLENDMTKEEVEAANFLMARLFLPAKDYMSTEYAMATRENYITHIRRGVGEAFIQTLGEVQEDGSTAGVTKAIRVAVSEIFASQKEQEIKFTILQGQTGKTVAFEKWFQFSLPRTGGLAPSKNVARASLAYARAYYKKKSLDRLVPEVQAMLKVQEQVKGYTERGLPNDPTVRSFVNEFLNDAKGRHVELLVKQGGTGEAILRVGVAWTAFKFLGFRPVLGMVNFIGEFVGTIRATTTREKWAGIRRTLEVQKSHRVNQNGKYFTERNPLLELFAPEYEITTRVKNAAMVLFSMATYFNNRFYLRAKMTEEEWHNELMNDDRMLVIVKEMSKWRKTNYYISSMAGNTAEGSVFSQFATWAFPMVTTTLSDLYQMKETYKTEGAKKAMTSEDAISFGKTMATMGTLMFIAMAIKALDPDDDDERDIWFYVTREMNTMIGAFSVLYDLEARAPALSQLYDLLEVVQQLLTQDTYKKDGVGYGIGDLKAWNSMQKLVEPTFMRAARESVTGKNEMVDTRALMIEDAITSGEFNAEKIAETMNTDDWNNKGSTIRTEEKQLEYRQGRVEAVTMEYSLRKKYPESKIADIVLSVDNNSERVAEMIKYSQEVGKDKAFQEVLTIYQDRAVCGNPKKGTVCPISQELFRAFRKENI